MKKGPLSLLSGFSAELVRRKVYPVIVAYAVVAWILLQIGEVTFGPLGVPDWIVNVAVGNSRVKKKSSDLRWDISTG